MTNNTCLICGAKLGQNTSCQDLYDQLSLYTLSHQDPTYFIHQHIVDAYGAQHITASTKPVAIAATLMGLYLFSERHYTGKQVQQAHMQASNALKTWPTFSIPTQKASITVADVLKAKPGKERDEMIFQWAGGVWQLWQHESARIAQLTQAQLIIN